MNLARNYERLPWSVSIELAAADATKVLKAAPGAGKRLVVTQWTYFSKTSAAQIMTIDDGTIFVGRLIASMVAGTMASMPYMDRGVAMTVNAALSINPAAAGPAGTVLVEGYIANV